MGVNLIYLGAALVIGWGVAHLFPTRSVVRGFGEISEDNRNIVRMEWIVEGLTLIFVDGVVALVTTIDSASSVAEAVHGTTSVFLIIMAVVSWFTGFRINFTPFKLCPVVFVTSAALILSGSLML
jgi:hypothetical protein